MPGARFLNDRATTRSMHISAGVFVLRYVSSSAQGPAPSVSVSAESGSGVSVITHDFSEIGFMSKPGEAVVLRASRQSSLLVRIFGQDSLGNNHAHLVLERVAAAGMTNSSLRAAEEIHEHDFGAPHKDIEILAHVARRGDVLTANGEWICGPSLPMAIEGLELRWPGRPAGLDISVSAAQLVRGQRKQLPAGTQGMFIGSRGKAIPLSGVSLALMGSAADGYTLECEALFLGTQVVRRSGTIIDLSGPTGLEPLVGLRLFVKGPLENGISAAPLDRQLPQARVDGFTGREHKEPALPKVGSSGRVRVFRTSQARPALNRN